MKKSLKTLILLALSLSCLANVHISDNGLGQAAVIPYYTVANGLNTLITVDNQFNEYKAIKVNLRDGKHGDALYSFNLYLKPHDVWTGALVDVGGFVQFASADESCAENLFSFDGGTPPTLPANDWTWITGQIELIEMGVIEDSFFIDRPTNMCDTITAAWDENGNDPTWRNDPSVSLLPPTGGIKVNAMVVDVANGFSFDVPILTLDGFFPSETVAHHPPESSLPDLSSGDTISMVIHDDEPIITQWPTGYEAVSALIMHTTIENDFDITPVASGQSEWVFSFPTWRYHLNDQETNKPFVVDDGQFVFPGELTRGGHIAYDREGNGSVPFCPLTCAPSSIYYSNHNLNTYYLTSSEQVQSSVISGPVTDQVRPFAVGIYADDLILSGKLSLTLDQPLFTQNNDRGKDPITLEKHTFHGLPVLGFAFQSYQNGGAQPGLLAAYATAKRHQGDQVIDIGETD